MATVDDYIADQELEVQPLLQSIRETSSANAPDALERIAWRMPTYWQGENLLHFAAFKNRIGLYPGADATVQFSDRLESYKTSKGAIQLPLSKPIDYTLIADIVRWRVDQVAG